MKRAARRTLGVIVGLTLGWYVAGVVMPWQPAQAAAPTAHDQPHAPSDAHGEHHGPAAGASAQQITAKLDQPWYHAVLYTALVLFTIAGAVGYAGWFHQEPQEEDDDHGHDDHHH